MAELRRTGPGSPTRRSARGRGHRGARASRTAITRRAADPRRRALQLRAVPPAGSPRRSRLARRLLLPEQRRRRRADAARRGRRPESAILDLDLHYPNGTAAIAGADEPTRPCTRCTARRCANLPGERVRPRSRREHSSPSASGADERDLPRRGGARRSTALSAYAAVRSCCRSATTLVRGDPHGCWIVRRRRSSNGSAAARGTRSCPCASSRRAATRSTPSPTAATRS